MSGTFCRRPSFLGDPSPSVGTPNTCFQLGAAADFLICHTGGIQDDLKQRISPKAKTKNVKDRLDAMLSTAHRMEVLNPALQDDLFKLSVKLIEAGKALTRGGKLTKKIPKAFITRMKVANDNALAICKKAKRSCGGS